MSHDSFRVSKYRFKNNKGLTNYLTESTKLCVEDWIHFFDFFLESVENDTDFSSFCWESCFLTCISFSHSASFLVIRFFSISSLAILARVSLSLARAFLASWACFSLSLPDSLSWVSATSSSSRERDWSCSWMISELISEKSAVRLSWRSCRVSWKKKKEFLSCYFRKYYLDLLSLNSMQLYVLQSLAADL